MSKSKLVLGICVMLLCISSIGLGNNMRQVWIDHVEVIDPKDSQTLPIYSVKTKEKKIAITFDLAWENEDIPDILEVLKEENVHATFFFAGGFLRRYPNDVKKIAKAGHDIANHGNSHLHLTQYTKEQQKKEILDANEEVRRILGKDMNLFRAPYGDYDAKLVESAKACNCYMIQWSVDSLDWKYDEKERIVRTVCEHKNLDNGAIILLHTGTKNTRYALKPMISQLKRKGYQIVPVSKLIYKKNYYINREGRQIKVP